MANVGAVSLGGGEAPGMACLIVAVGSGEHVDPKAKANDQDKARKDLKDSLITLAPVFSDTDFFLSEDFTLVDCCLAPLLWRLKSMGVELNGRGAKEVEGYMERLFARESFQASLTTLEQEFHETEY